MGTVLQWIGRQLNQRVLGCALEDLGLTWEGFEASIDEDAERLFGTGADGP